VYAPWWAPGELAGAAHAGVIFDLALDDEDLFIAEVSMARDDRAGLVTDEHGLPVTVAPQHLPVHAGPSLIPRPGGHIDVLARRLAAHGTSTSIADPLTRAR
jgi:hypothetical protein